MDCMEPKCDPKNLECIHATLLQSCTFTSICYRCRVRRQRPSSLLMSSGTTSRCGEQNASNIFNSLTIIVSGMTGMVGVECMATLWVLVNLLLTFHGRPAPTQILRNGSKQEDTNAWMRMHQVHQVHLQLGWLIGHPHSAGEGNPKNCECNGQLNAGGGGECNNVHKVRMLNFKHL